MAAPEELDLDPIEPVPEEPKSKGSKVSKAANEPNATAGKPTKDAKPTGKGGKGGDDPEERAPRKSVAGDRKVPYPVSPADVPEGLTDYAESFTKQQSLLLAGLFVFLIFYIGMILLFVLTGVWSVYALRAGGPLPLIGLLGIIFSSIFFLFLVKGFFKRYPINKNMHVEITEADHPVLFEFIYRLCDELGAPLPNKVYVSPDVNAACISRTSLLNLFVEPKRDLLIGLGLVNSMNLSEFKGVLAHEFGHFCHLGHTSSYANVVHNIIVDLVRGEDWFDRMVNWCKNQKNAISIFGHVIGAPLWVGRKVLWWFFRLITLQELAVSREQEFHADLVAVSAAGSDAITHGLLRARFGMYCFMQAVQDLHTAMDHKLYSNDLYLHQDRAASVVRRKKKEPEMGLPPAIDGPTAGKNVRVFDAEQDELEDEDETPPMWRSHPNDADRETNAKERYVPAVIDHRSPWILFDDVVDLKERMTYKFYRMHPAFQIAKNADLTDAQKVQKFIDNEHADTTYDPKYKGAYDERILEPGELSELNGLVRDAPWTEERMEKVLDKLYDGCEEHAEAHSELYKEMETLTSGIVGRPSKTMKRKIEEVEQKQETNRDWFKSFDRRVYLLHVQMAAQVDKDLRDELVERYRFQLEVQRFYFESRQAFNKADAYFSAYIAAAQGKIQVSPDFAGEVMQVLRESWKTLKHIIKDAREINLPAMKNFEEGDNLADFILEGKMVPEPPLSYVKGVWINKLMTQLQGVRMKCFRLHFKSVGGILRLHEEVAAKWKALREPVAAEVLEDEPVAAEVIEGEPRNLDVMGGAGAVLTKEPGGGRATASPDEPIAAEVIPAEVIAEVLEDEPIAAEVIPDEPIAAAVIPAEVVAEPTPTPAQAAASEPPKSMAAFVSAVAAEAMHELHSPPTARPAPAAAPPAPPPAAPAPVVKEPEPPTAPKPVEALPSADPFDFRPPPPRSAPPPKATPAKQPAPVAPAAKPTPVAEISGTFSLDSGLPLPVKPKSVASAAPAPPVAAAEIFSLDGDGPAPAKPVEVAFSLDMDDRKSAPAPAPGAPAAKPASGGFPAAAAPVGSTAVPAAAPRPAPAPAAKPAPTTPTLSGMVELPTGKPAFGSGTKPKINRPPIKITMVKPGETSPLPK